MLRRLFFFSGEEAERWLQRGIRILQREIPEQILSDGGHFERSPMYHLLVMEDLLDLLNIFQRYKLGVPKIWNTALTAMTEWAAVMQHPDGEIPFFNDAAFEIALTPAEVLKYADQFGFRPSNKRDSALVYFSETGYARMQQDQAMLFLDSAPIGPDYLPSHAHADTLSFELSLHQQRVIVNGGTSVYGTGYERQRQRSTLAHSTVSVDRQNSSQVWSGFRVARRAHVFNVSCEERGSTSWFKASHNGFRSLPGKPTHQRQWLLETSSLLVVDEITGNGEHRIDSVFPLHPQLTPITADVHEVWLMTNNKVLVRFHADPQTTLTVKQTTWHPRFGMSESAWCIQCNWSGCLPIKLQTRLTWATVETV